jgi:hypothetical protein
MNGLFAVVLTLAHAGEPAKVVDFSVGTLTVPEGCRHVPGRGIDSAVGTVECGETKVHYDIGFASPGAKPDVRGWCTAEQGFEFQPSRVMELRTEDGRTLFICDLPRYHEEPARLVAVLSPHASFWVYAKGPADATWLIRAALAFRGR